MFQLSFLLLLWLPFIAPTTFYVINDIHYDPNYKSSLPPSSNLCRGISHPVKNTHYEEFPNLKANPLKDSSFKPSIFGQFGCDSSLKLMEIMLDQLKKQDPNPDIIYLPGDFVAHGYAQDKTLIVSNKTYNILLDVHSNISQQIKIRFPNALIIPSLGNNDHEFHDQVPDLKQKYSFYNFLFDTWFEDHIPNSKLTNLAEIRSTFLDGGFYRVDFSDELSIFSMNTVYFTKGNDDTTDPAAAMNQMNWLRAHLASIKTNEPNRKAIITYHVLPGYKYNGGASKLWDESYVVEFDDILQEYNSVILTVVTAHTHSHSIRAYKQESKQGLFEKKPSYGPTIVCPSITPIYLNNPGFTSIEIGSESEIYKLKSVKFSYLNLEKLNTQINPEKITNFSSFFFDIIVEKEYGLADFSSESIGSFISNLKDNDDLLKKFLVFSLGFPLEVPYKNDTLGIFQAMGLMNQKNGVWQFDSNERKMLICTLKHLKQADYEAC